MSNLTKTLEQQKLEEVAADYKQKGYSILVQPKADKLPDFLADFQPDLIAQNEKENVVVEIKTHASLVGAKYLEALAQVISNTSGWRFELVVTNPEEDFIAEETNAPLIESDSAKRLEEARNLLKSGYYDAALLIGWSAVEGILRELGEREKLVFEKKGPAYLIKNLAFLGILNDQDYDSLWNMLKARNVIAHGYDIAENKVELATNLFDLIDRLTSKRKKN
jgi:hypothetical protein